MSSHVCPTDKCVASSFQEAGPNLYLISHYGAYKAFEDYCLGLSRIFNQMGKKTIIIVFHNESEIPIASARSSLYFFLSYIPPKFYKRHLNGTSHVYLINTEQSTRPTWNLMLRHYTEHKIPIYDYDLYQSQNWAMGHYLPYQITVEETASLGRLLTESPKYYHVAICSVNSPKRANIYQQLQQHGLKVIDVSGWKEDRDQKIAQAQILVNIHYNDDYRIFEHFRCDRWVLSGMLTVSETSLSDQLLDFKNLLIIEDYPRIVTKIMEIMSNYDYYQQAYIKKLILVKNQIINDRKKQVLSFPWCDALKGR